MLPSKTLLARRRINGLASTEKGTYVVQDVGPSFEGDTLENGQHGESEIVEIGDARIGPRPPVVGLFAADHVEGGTVEASLAARMRILHHFAY